MIDPEIKKARDAERVLSDPLFIEAFDKIEGKIIEMMRRAPMGDVQTHHELVLYVQLLRDLKRHFTDIVQTGKMAEIKRDSTLKDKVRRIVRP